MALASQNSRPERTASPKARGKPMLLMVTIAAAGACVGAYWLISKSAGSDFAMQRAANAAEFVLEPAPVITRSTAPITTAITTAITTPITTPISRPSTEPTPSPTALDQAIAMTGTIQSEPTATPATQEQAKPDLVKPEVAKPEVAKPDAAKPDVAKPDVAKPDAAKPDAAKPDAAKDETAKEPRSPAKFDNGFKANGPAQTPPASAPAGSPAAQLQEGLSLGATDPIKARLLLSQALLSDALSEGDARQASNALSRFSAQLFLTPVYNANDSSCFQYTILPNDSLEKIVRKNKLGCDWRLVARMNNIKKPDSIQVGKRIKLPKGPFSAVISKRDYRLDICMGIGSDRIVVASLPVGLGEAGGTPLGRFRVRAGSKLLNPEWTHPVNGQRFEADDPANPIGEHWLGLEGIEESNSKFAGYGIHGTIDNDSIGHDRSLGCVRLLAADVALVWESLADGAEIEIRK